MGPSSRSETTRPSRLAALQKQLWGSGKPPDQDQLEASVLSPGITPASYEGVNEKYLAALLHQYLTYVEMADRISARRGLANTFFLTLNTVVITALTTSSIRNLQRVGWGLLIPLAVLVGECVTWFWMVRSYRQLNGAKYAVIGALERKLPASPYWGAEWKALGEGKDRSLYWPITHLEQTVPLMFAAAYVAGAIAIAVT
jgi:hypothetical protein